jgi:hypothetical protein
VTRGPEAELDVVIIAVEDELFGDDEGNVDESAGRLAEVVWELAGAVVD